MALFRTANVGTADRVIRIVLAAAATIVAYDYLTVLLVLPCLCRRPDHDRHGGGPVLPGLRAFWCEYLPDPAAILTPTRQALIGSQARS